MRCFLTLSLALYLCIFFSERIELKHVRLNDMKILIDSTESE